jgi:uncharacterized membrane protein
MRALLIVAGALPWAFIALGAFGIDMRPAFAAFCHQIPEKSLTFFGTPMVICSRCSGIYAGVAIGAIIPPLAFMERHGRAAVFIALFLVILDVVTQNYLLHTINHPLRLATGFIAGWTASAYLFASLESPSACRID